MADNQFMKISAELEVISRCEQNQAKSYNETDSMVWCTRGRRMYLPRLFMEYLGNTLGKKDAYYSM